MSAGGAPIKVGLVGYGRAVVQQHAREMEAVARKFQVAAVCVRDKERQELARARYHCAIYDDYQAFLHDPRVELVDIATPSVDHTPMAIAALDAGKRVFLEKPIGVSYAEAQALEAAAERWPGKLLIRLNRRFFSDFVQVKDLIDSGILGQVHLIRVRFLKYDLRDDWQTLKKHGGGMLLAMGPHFIDHCLELLGWQYQLLWADVKLVAAQGDAEDTVKILFRGKNGMVVDLEMSGGAALEGVSFTAFGKHGALACDGKTVRVRYYDPRKVVPRAARAESPDVNAPFGSGIAIPWVEKTFPVLPPKREIWTEVYKAVREGAEFPITVEQAVRVMKVIDDVRAMTA